MKQGIQHMGCKSVVSIAAIIEDEDLRNAIIKSDYIRNETMNRCLALPSYRYKSLKWKNRYYDHFKKIVEREAADERISEPRDCGDGKGQIPQRNAGRADRDERPIPGHATGTKGNGALHG